MSEVNEKTPLLEVRNLRKLFAGKSSFFQKDKSWIKAVDDVSFTLNPKETLGVVGESGCGKSTFGRVLLQLYEQTAGSTMYYGRTLDAVAPDYVLDTIKNANSYIAKYHKAAQHAEEMAKKCDELGDNASFFDIQDKNLAACDAKTALDYAVKILGGFMVRDTAKGAELLENRYRHAFKAAEIATKIEKLNTEIEAEEGVAARDAGAYV